MKLKEFSLTTKDNTSCYDPMDYYLNDRNFIILSSKKKILGADFIVEIYFESEGAESVYVAHHSVVEIVNWFKETHPDIYELIPKFDVEQFEKLAHEMKSSSTLEFKPVGEDGFEVNIWGSVSPDDFVPERETTQQSIDEINEKGWYTSIQCYPRTPVGFFSHYGIDFQSLLDHVTKED